MRQPRPPSVARLLSERARQGRQELPPAEPAGMSGLFDTLRQLADRVAALAEASGEQVKEEQGQSGRMVFGYTVRVGLDGARAEPFGHMPEAGKAPQAETPRQPIVDVFEEPGGLLVIAELPGIEAADISCQVRDGKLRIETAGARRWGKTIALPVPVDAASLRQSCRNGILEIRLDHAAVP